MGEFPIPAAGRDENRKNSLIFIGGQKRIVTNEQAMIPNAPHKKPKGSGSAKQDSFLWSQCMYNESMKETGMIMNQVNHVFAALLNAGLDAEHSVVIIRNNSSFYGYTYDGRQCETESYRPAFYGDYRIGICSAGTYSSLLAGRQRRVRAALDDAAQMFGSYIPVSEKIKAHQAAQFLSDGTFFVLGRFETEAEAAAILMEKCARTEIAAHRMGNLHYLNPLLAKMEHAVYLKKYSAAEKKRAAQ